MPLTHRRFTVDEYHRMAEAGILTEDDRVELLDGEIVEMSPIGPRHAGTVKQLNRLFAPFHDRVVVSVQDPVVLDAHAEPEPDVAILRVRHYTGAHPGPGDIRLVIEVADTSVEYDRSRKLPAYARAGIPEAWLVNLPDEVIEVYREPKDGLYVLRQIVRGSERLSPLHLPDVVFRASDILG